MLKSKIYLLLFLCCLLSLTVLEAKSKIKQPDWINNPQIKYPESQFLSRVGIASSPAKAEKKALAAIAQYFETSVTSSSNNSEDEKIDSKNGVTNTSSKSHFKSNIETFSKAKIQFSEAVETWQNPDNKNYYVLVVIDKKKTVDINHNQIQEREKLITHYLSYTENQLQKYSYLQKAVSCSKDSELSFYYYNVLADAGLPKINPVITTEELESMLTATRQELSFNITVSGDSQDIILNTLQETTTELGFSNNSDGPLQMDVTITPTGEKMMGKQVFAGYSATIQLNFENNQIFSLTDKVQQGDIDTKTAHDRAIKALGRSIGRKFNKEFRGYLEKL